MLQRSSGCWSLLSLRPDAAVRARRRGRRRRASFHRIGFRFNWCSRRVAIHRLATTPTGSVLCRRWVGWRAAPGPIAGHRSNGGSRSPDRFPRSWSQAEHAPAGHSKRWHARMAAPTEHVHQSGLGGSGPLPLRGFLERLSLVLRCARLPEAGRVAGPVPRSANPEAGRCSPAAQTKTNSVSRHAARGPAKLRQTRSQFSPAGLWTVLVRLVAIAIIDRVRRNDGQRKPQDCACQAHDAEHNSSDCHSASGLIPARAVDLVLADDAEYKRKERT